MSQGEVEWTRADVEEWDAWLVNVRALDRRTSSQVDRVAVELGLLSDLVGAADAEQAGWVSGGGWNSGTCGGDAVELEAYPQL